jgi:hypothetical protein
MEVRILHLDAMQGSSEALTETYLTYSEGALQLLTPRCVRSASGATSLSGWQAGALHKSFK